MKMSPMERVMENLILSHLLRKAAKPNGKYLKHSSVIGITSLIMTPIGIVEKLVSAMTIPQNTFLTLVKEVT